MTARGPEELPEEDQRVAQSRRRVEERVAELRTAVRSDFGLVPRTAGWVLPALGFAVGFGLAVRAFRRRRALRR
jgi:hypothetical protein